jgi:hypothetical protein
MAIIAGHRWLRKSKWRYKGQIHQQKPFSLVLMVTNADGTIGTLGESGDPLVTLVVHCRCNGDIGTKGNNGGLFVTLVIHW